MGKKIAVFLFSCLCLAALCFCAWQLTDNWRENNGHDQEIESLQDNVDSEGGLQPGWNGGVYVYPDGITIDWANLDSMNPDIVGWLVVPGTDLNFPVVHPTDSAGDEYYLNHTYLGEYNIYGSIFISWNNKLTDDNIIIYGHSTDVGSMFTSLSNYAESGYGEAHSNLYLYWNDGSMTHGTLIDFRITNNKDPIYSYTIPENVLPVPAKKIISLSTCNLYYGYNSDQRLLAVFKVE